jgi:hypothetical protein
LITYPAVASNLVVWYNPNQADQYKFSLIRNFPALDSVLTAEFLSRSSPPSTSERSSARGTAASFALRLQNAGCKILRQQMANSTEVGYGRPPIRSRFQPGQSGNPRGRPKRRTIKADLRDALSATTGRSDGSTKQETLVQKLVDDAVGGDLASMKLLFALTASLLRDESDPEPDEADRQADPDEMYLEKLADRERLDAESKDPSKPKE